VVRETLVIGMSKVTMTKTERRVMVTAENVLAKMIPGNRDSLRDIAQRVSDDIADVRIVLAECVARRVLRMEGSVAIRRCAMMCGTTCRVRATNANADHVVRP
jgi:hypothetical protein